MLDTSEDQDVTRNQVDKVTASPCLATLTGGTQPAHGRDEEVGVRAYRAVSLEALTLFGEPGHVPGTLGTFDDEGDVAVKMALVLVICAEVEFWFVSVHLLRPEPQSGWPKPQQSQRQP